MLGAVHGDADGDRPAYDWGLRFHTGGGAAVTIGTHAVDSTKSQAYVVVRDRDGLVWSLPPKFHYEIERMPLMP